MYCGRTVGFKSCVYTVHIQVYTSGNKKLRGPESKPAKQLTQFNLVEKCQNTISFGMKYCIVLSQWISEKKKWPVAQCSNDRVVFASMLHVFIASVNKRKQHFWLTEDFILSPSNTASSWQSSLHPREILYVLQGQAYCSLEKCCISKP